MVFKLPSCLDHRLCGSSRNVLLLARLRWHMLGGSKITQNMPCCIVHTSCVTQNFEGHLLDKSALLGVGPADQSTLACCASCQNLMVLIFVRLLKICSGLMCSIFPACFQHAHPLCGNSAGPQLGSQDGWKSTGCHLPGQPKTEIFGSHLLVVKFAQFGLDSCATPHRCPSSWAGSKQSQPTEVEFPNPESRAWHLRFDHTFFACAKLPCHCKAL